MSSSLSSDSSSDYLSQSCIPPFLSRNRPVLCCDDNPSLSDYSDSKKKRYLNNEVFHNISVFK